MAGYSDRTVESYIDSPDQLKRLQKSINHRESVADFRRCGAGCRDYGRRPFSKANAWDGCVFRSPFCLIYFRISRSCFRRRKDFSALRAPYGFNCRLYGRRDRCNRGRCCDCDQQHHIVVRFPGLFTERAQRLTCRRGMSVQTWPIRSNGLKRSASQW